MSATQQNVYTISFQVRPLRLHFLLFIFLFYFFKSKNLDDGTILRAPVILDISAFARGFSKAAVDMASDEG